MTKKKSKSDQAAKASTDGSNEKASRKLDRNQSVIPTSSDDSFPIVGVGASAGGLPALTQLFDAMPDSPGMALVIVQHLDPTKKSFTAELLAKRTRMTFCEVHDSPKVLVNTVYVIPPGKYLSITGGTLKLSEPDQPRGARMAIDFFLRSLAKDAKQRGVAVVMSGSGADGTLGVKAVKEAGGMVIVQSPESAEHDGMPRSAIDTHAADHILSPDRIPEVLMQYAQHPYVRQADVTPAEDERPNDTVAFQESEVYTAILSLLRVRSKYDFRNYKDKTLFRRIRRRMCLKHMEEYKQYLDYLRGTPEEVNSLVKDMLISVTDFFRDPDAWNDFRKLAIEPLIERKTNDEPIRVWLPGCATGEEPYTLAMLLLETLSEAKKICPLQIFASDIDKDALDFARIGIYPMSIEVDVSSERLRKFFIKNEQDLNYRVSKQLRESIVFAEQNLIGDPPFSKLDILCCRNLLIYLKPETQEKIISLFHFALQDEGYLFLGSAETLGRHDDLFETLNKRWRIFRRTTSVQPGQVDFPVFPPAVHSSVGTLEAPTPDQRETRLASLANQWLMDWLAPSAVIIDSKWNIVYVIGEMDQYLKHQSGVPTENLLDKVRRGLRAKLRGAVHRAMSEQRPVTLNARMFRDGQYHEVHVTVRRITSTDDKRELALVLFEELERPEELAGSETTTKRGKKRPAARGKSLNKVVNAERDLELDDHHIIRQLEQELAATKDDLQSTIEQYESSNEEFKAANEEVMSINEELQSTNEELETSKEELQSLNEELSTVNNQLASKVDELETKHADLENLLAATDVATICLDTDLNIRWFTPSATRMIRLKELDVGRPVSDFTHDFVQGDMNDVAAQVLKQLIPIEDEVTCYDGRTFLRRVFPYRTDDHRIRGVVMTFVDITERKHADEALKESEQRFKRLSESLDQQVRDRTAVMAVLHDITEAANEAKSIESALQAALDRIVDYNHWVVGHAWKLMDNSVELTSTRVWSFSQRPVPSALTAFHACTEAICIPLGGDLVGQVAQSGRPKWLDSTRNFQGWLRDNPADFGLNSAVAFPIAVDGQAVAVLEFFSDRAINRENRFLEIMPSVSIQLGHVYERKRLEREVAMVADREQRRIGEELHDGLSQQIAGMAMLARSLADNLSAVNEPNAERAEILVKAAEDAKVQARSLSKGLVPIEIHPDGLRRGLEELCERTATNHRIECLFTCREPHVPVDGFASTHIYRIATEAVHNAVKHAHASSIRILLGSGQPVLLTVQDDGVGFDASKIHAGEGLRIMQHRAGLIGATITIEQNQSGGTILSCKAL